MAEHPRQSGRCRFDSDPRRKLVSQFLIYVLYDPRYAPDDARQLFYIGQTQRGVAVRVRQHLKGFRTDHNPRKAAWLGELVSVNLSPRVDVLEALPEPPADASERTPFQQALALAERRWIQAARADLGARLLNMTDGGENVVGPMLGRRFSSEHRDKLSKAHTGKTVSEATRVKLSLYNTGRSRHLSYDARNRIATASRLRVRKPITEETRARIIAARRGVKQSAEHVAKRTAGQRGRNDSVETRARKSAAKFAQTAETRARISASKKGHAVSQETRDKIAASLRARSLQCRS